MLKHMGITRLDLRLLFIMMKKQLFLLKHKLFVGQVELVQFQREMDFFPVNTGMYCL